MNSEDQTFDDALGDLAHFLRAIEEYLDRVILCGGWVPYFYRHLPALAAPRHGPLLTYDFDFVAPPVLPPKEGGTLRDLLLNSDFVAIRNREPPVVYYQHERWGTEELAPVYGEFLTPLVGSEQDRSGTSKVVRDVQTGVAAQQLRYLDLLLHEPLTIQAGQVPRLSVSGDLEVRIPNPATYILQKALALKQRKPDKRPKDLAYVYEVATLWFHQVERVRAMTGSISSRSHEWSRWVERGGDVLRGAFESDDAEGPVSAEQVLGATVDGQMVRATTVARVTDTFLKSILAEP